jgi:hypothetical protein
MLSTLQQKRVWENLLSAEIRAKYFAELSNCYRWHQQLANWIAVLLSSGAFLSLSIKLLKEGPGWISWLTMVFALATAAVSVYSVVAQNYDRAMSGIDLHSRWNKLSKDYETLWDAMDNERALDRLQHLEEIGTELSKAGIMFPNLERRLLKSQRYVEQQHHTTA